MVERVDWGEAREILEGLGSDDLTDVCYILDLPYSGTKRVKIGRILNSEYDVDYVRRRVSSFLFGLTLLRFLSAVELADITREYGLHTYRSKRGNMLEIIQSEEVSPRVLLGQFTIHVLRDVYVDVYGESSNEGRDGLIRGIIGFFELEWMSGGMALGFIMMAMKKDDNLERTYQVVKEVCGEFDIRAERIDETATSGVINDEVLEKIRESEHLFVDLTHERPNVYYELGYTHGLGKSLDRIVLMARKGTRLHFDIRNMRTIFYEDHKQLRRELGKRLEAINKRDAG